ncbi:hypothetical protein BH11BAC4_BH11BAC4_14770 [soil metagenome]
MPFYRYRQIPYGSKHLGKGIWLNWSGNSIAITANLELSGAAATPDMANRMKQTIETIWNASFDQGYRVSCTVNMRFRGTGVEDSTRNQIIATVDGSATNVSPFPTLYYSSMNYHLNTTTVIDWTPAHEFGHMLGLDDHYSESIWSRIRDLCGYSRSTMVHPGWQGNIMAVHRGTMERRNLQELFAIHASELVTIAEDYVEDFWRGLDGSIRQLYGVPF